jgi:hypothetical protein
VRFADQVGIAISAVDARLRLRALADEQAALLRVAELVARGAAADEVFVAISDEASALLGELPVALMLYDDGGAVVVATCNCPAPVGLHVPFSAGTAIDRMYRTGRPAHMDTYEDTPLADVTREVGITSTTAVPIIVEGRVRAALVSSNVAATTRTAVESSPGPVRGAGRGGDRQRRDPGEAHRIPCARRGHGRRDPSAPAARRPRRRAAAAGPRRHRAQDGAQHRRGGLRGLGFVEEALTNVERASSELRDIVHGILPRSLTHGGLRIGWSRWSAA